MLAAGLRRPDEARVEFQRQLDAVTARLVELVAEVAGRVGPVAQAFVEGDTGVTDDYRRSAARIRRTCRDLEDDCYLLLARQAPVAGDLRRTVSIVRSSAHVERSSHLLLHILDALAWVHPPALAERLRTVLRELGERVAAIQHGASVAWRTLDGLAAIDLETADDEVDFLHKVLLTELYVGPQSTEEAVSLALVARYFERIGDHGVELARQVAYAVTGARAGGRRGRHV